VIDRRGGGEERFDAEIVVLKRLWVTPLSGSSSLMMRRRNVLYERLLRRRWQVTFAFLYD